jgi:putative tricarboxylic transport membrane protein
VKKRELISSLFWLAVGLVLAVLSATYPIGSLGQPGPGFLPLGLGLLLILFSLVLLMRAVKLQAKGEKERLFPSGVMRIAAVVVILIAAIIAFEPLGYLLTFVLLGVLLTLVTGWMRLRGSIVFAVLAVAGIYVIFVWLLKQPLPTGVLGV